jgi:hypothetical protein
MEYRLLTLGREAFYILQALLVQAK